MGAIESHVGESIEAIRVKRRWMTGDATDDELRFARMAAQSAVDETSVAAWFAARSTEGAAAWVAEMKAGWEHEVVMLRALIDEWEEGYEAQDGTMVLLLSAGR